MIRKSLLSAVAILSIATFASPARADMILGGQLYYGGGDVAVILDGGSASYHNFLALYLVNGDINSDVLLENHDTVGTTATISAANMAALGYEIGDELVFGIEVATQGSHDEAQGNTRVYLMGPGSRNPDEIEHAILDDSDAPAIYRVGFEDIFGGGDRDFNDTVFAFTDGVTVPTPATLFLLGLGLVGIGTRRRMKDGR